MRTVLKSNSISKFIKEKKKEKKPKNIVLKIILMFATVYRNPKVVGERIKKKARNRQSAAIPAQTKKPIILYFLFLKFWIFWKQ